MFKLLLATCLVGCAFAYPSGALESSCVNLRPGHGVEFQPNNPGYTIATRVTSEGIYNVTLYGPPFKGYIMQAFLEDGSIPVGYFGVTNSHDQVICQGSGVTHTNASPVTDVTVRWRGPQGPKVQFKATVVESYDTVFGNIVSAPVISFVN